MMKLKTFFLLTALILLADYAWADGREKLNFNGGWLMKVGDIADASSVDYADGAWQRVTLPRAFNEDEAFAVPIDQHSDTIVWYRKHFQLANTAQRKVFVEFEGVRFGAEVWINGHSVGITENGVMASGFDLSPYVRDGENVLSVRVDNSWRYHERATGSTWQWNNKNFNANYGGIPKNVFLHLTDQLYQTLPLYSNLGTTGVYVYGTDYDVKGHRVKWHAESEVKNESPRARTFIYNVVVKDKDGRQVSAAKSDRITLQSGEKTTAKAEGLLTDAHFWSWGYGYLYTVETTLQDAEGQNVDRVLTRTGFRKTAFKDGIVWLNDRALTVHGYAQRTSNEWPAVGMSVPAWLSDYSNKLMIESCGNVVRWMHVTPWKQDVESCDRVGLIQAMPAGDAEKDIEGRRWEQRVLLMRDAIIYNRNNPSILFYESGNESISQEHMREMRDLRDEFDPYGGRAIGSREMLDIAEAEYGGEMLYVNKSKRHPLWMMEYCRDEGLRKYWDSYSYPFHKEGDGPLYRGQPATAYNHNMDEFAVEMVRRWYDYWQERYGSGKRVNAGGVKIVFSDTNTHFRGESNYRTSGVTDAMRIPKDAFFAHQVMWDGWVEPEAHHTYIVGHWNYDEGTRKPVYVVSDGQEVELFVNGKSMGKGENSYRYLFTFNDIAFESGRVEAVSYDANGQELSRHAIETVGQPDHLQLTVIQNPQGFKADGADMALLQFEVVDKDGRRCPLDNRDVNFDIWGEGEWRGGIATCSQAQAGGQSAAATSSEGLLDGPSVRSSCDNHILSRTLPVECGVNRALIRSTVNAGTIVVTAAAKGLKPVTIELQTEAVDVANYLPSLSLPCDLSRGETPLTPSFQPFSRGIDIISARAGSNQSDINKSFDDNELSEWKSDGTKENAWVTYTLAAKAAVDEVVIKPAGWRNKQYPLAIYAGKKLLWQGLTAATLGYCHIKLAKPVRTNQLTVKMLGPSQHSAAFGDTKELAGGNANELDRIASAKGAVDLRIVEIEFHESIK